jgi:DNA-binding MarR family transcriptional regulator
MLAVTNSLTEQGLVERRASQLDRRTVALHITPEGETMLRAAKSAIAKHERALRRGMPREETAFLLHLLKRFAEGARSDEDVRCSE